MTRDKVHAFNESNVDLSLGHIVDKVKFLSYMLNDDAFSTERVQGEITNIFLELSQAQCMISQGVQLLGMRIEILEYELGQASRENK